MRWRAWVAGLAVGVMVVGGVRGEGPATREAGEKGQTLAVPDDFSAAKMMTLLGMSREHPLVKGAVKLLEMGESQKFGSGILRGRSVALMYREGYIERIIFQCAKSETSMPFGGELPAGIARDATAESLVKRFGKPRHESRDEGKVRGMYWTDLVKGTDIAVSFDEKGAMTEITVDMAEKEAPAVGEAEGKARAAVVERVKKVLPAGWGVKVEKDFMYVSRGKKVKGNYVGGVDGPMGGAAEDLEYGFGMHFGPAMTRAEYGKAVEAGKEKEKKLAEILAQQPKGDAQADTDPDDFVGFESPKHAALMAAYVAHEEVRTLWRDLPTHEAAGCSLIYGEWPGRPGPDWSWARSHIAVEDEKEREECNGTKARVLGMFGSYQWKENTNKIVGELMGKLEEFEMTLMYIGPGDAKAKGRPMSVVVGTKNQKLDVENWTYVPVSVDRAAGLVMEMAWKGIMERLANPAVITVAEVKGPAYTLTVTGGGSWYGVMGWDSELVQGLDLDSNGSELGKVLEPMKGPLKELIVKWGRERD